VRFFLITVGFSLDVDHSLQGALLKSGLLAFREFSAKLVNLHHGLRFVCFRNLESQIMKFAVAFDLELQDLAIDDVRGMVDDLLDFLVSFVFESHKDFNVHEAPGVDVPRLEESCLDCQHVEMAERLEVVTVVTWA